MAIGYFLATEEYTPAGPVRQARLTQDHGISSLWLSDHFHPWTGEQGQPSAEVRLSMLEEAVEVIRKLLSGEVLEHRSEHYTVDHARSPPGRSSPCPSTSPATA